MIYPMMIKTRFLSLYAPPLLSKTVILPIGLLFMLKEKCRIFALMKTNSWVKPDTGANNLAILGLIRKYDFAPNIFRVPPEQR